MKTSEIFDLLAPINQKFIDEANTLEYVRNCDVCVEFYSNRKAIPAENCINYGGSLADALGVMAQRDWLATRGRQEDVNVAKGSLTAHRGEK